MARPTKTQPAIDTADTVIDQEAVSGAMVAMRDQAQEDQATLIELATSIGAIQAMSLVNSFTSSAQVQLFRQIRDSKQINNLPIRQGNGELTRFTSMRDACPVIFGRTYESMLEAETRMATFGEDAYETAARLGLNRSALRAARALPPEKLEAVRLAISSGSSKAEVLSVIEDLAEKIETAEKQVTELQAENTASEELLSKRDATIKRLEREVKRFEKLPPDEKRLALQKDATAMMNDARGAIQGTLRQAFIAVVNSVDDRHEHDVFLAGLLGQVQAELNALRAEFDLPDVSAADKQKLAAEMAEWDK